MGFNETLKDKGSSNFSRKIKIFNLNMLSSRNLWWIGSWIEIWGSEERMRLKASFPFGSRIAAHTLISLNDNVTAAAASQFPLLVLLYLCF